MRCRTSPTAVRSLSRAGADRLHRISTRCRTPPSASTGGCRSAPASLTRSTQAANGRAIRSRGSTSSARTIHRSPAPMKSSSCSARSSAGAPTDRGRTAFQSHSPLGFHFLLGTICRRRRTAGGAFAAASNVRRFISTAMTPSRAFASAADRTSRTFSYPDVFSLEVGASEDVQNQSNWKQCRNCFALYWALHDIDAGFCPASGQHVRPWRSVPGAAHLDRAVAFGQSDWRFCVKCFSLFWDGGDEVNGVCAGDGGPHEAAGAISRCPSHRAL